MDLLAAGVGGACTVNAAQYYDSASIKNVPELPNTDHLSDLPSITMRLLGSPTSENAHQAIDAIAESLFQPSVKRKRPPANYLRAMGAIVADLLHIASFEEPYAGFRRMDAGSFSAKEVAYRPFDRALDDLVRHGLVVIKRGQRAIDDRPGRVTRIMPTTAFRELLARHGIDAATRLLHFTHTRPPLPDLPVRLRASSTTDEKFRKKVGKTISVDRADPMVIALVEPIVAINAELRKYALSLDITKLPSERKYITFKPDLALFRSFNCGDEADYAWNKGGRLNCYDGGYQNLKKECRSAIMIDGRETVEVDILSCYLTIYYSLLGVPLPSKDELYNVVRLDRQIVKSFVNYLIGLRKVPSRWSSELRKDYDAANPNRLSKEYPMKVVAPKIMSAMPILKQILATDYNWADLMFIESSIMTEVVYELAVTHGVCALPIHDSVRVSKEHVELAISCLSKAFYNRTGIYPILKLK